MTSLTSRAQIFSGDATVVDTILNHPLGTIATDVDGNEYIYLQGVAGTVAGSWVVFNESHITTLTLIGVRGRIGVAMAAIVASRFGWYQIYGRNAIALSSAAIANNVRLYVTATAGRVGGPASPVVPADLVDGSLSRSAPAGAGLFTVELMHPVALG